MVRFHEGFHKELLKRLEIYGKVVPIDLTAMETPGGGSASMKAEIFSEEEMNVNEPGK